MLFYEVKITYQRQTGENTPSSVKETYLVEGLTIADVESRLMEELRPYMFGETEVPSCKKAQFYDILPSTDGDRWFKARVEMITIEDSGKEKRKGVSILVGAATIDDAMKNLLKQLSQVDCEVVSIARSPILDVLRAI
ncbi:MAG: DUF4494 domain-containing protein [Paludibacteraceae bacterium]|nr:DUF4494 domain-containing protein [Paludibacteraceae bacterium]